MQKIVVATGNPGKLREIAKILADLSVEVIGLSEFPPIVEPEENEPDFAGNAREKALYYAQQTGSWCIADDSGLVVDALAGAPGVFSARYAAEDCPADSPREIIDQANNAKLIRSLANTPAQKRTARFVCYLALAKPGEVLAETSGAVEGRIVDTPAGEAGFGYDPHFYIDALSKTTAQLGADEKNAISHRGQAVRKLAKLLPELLSK